jgi:putative ABC transport system substrate-binding protein
VEALKAAVAGHTVTVHDLGGSRQEADRVLPGVSASVMVALGPLAAEAARKHRPEMPLVYCMVNDPASVPGLDGANVTGVSFNVPARNQLVAFHAVHPTATRIGVIYGSAATGRQIEEARRAASALKLQVVARQVDSLQSVPQSVRELLKGQEPVDALWIPADPLVLGDETRRFILLTAMQAGKPVYSSTSALVREGALVSNSPELGSIGQSAGELVNRIARGEKPGRIAVALPRTEVVINRRIADQLKVAIPDQALKAAQRVF